MAVQPASIFWLSCGGFSIILAVLASFHTLGVAQGEARLQPSRPAGAWQSRPGAWQSGPWGWLAAPIEPKPNPHDDLSFILQSLGDWKNKLISDLEDLSSDLSLPQGAIASSESLLPPNGDERPRLSDLDSRFQILEDLPSDNEERLPDTLVGSKELGTLEHGLMNVWNKPWVNKLAWNEPGWGRLEKMSKSKTSNHTYPSPSNKPSLYRKGYKPEWKKPVWDKLSKLSYNEIMIKLSKSDEKAHHIEEKSHLSPKNTILEYSANKAPSYGYRVLGMPSWNNPKTNKGRKRSRPGWKRP